MLYKSVKDCFAWALLLEFADSLLVSFVSKVCRCVSHWSLCIHNAYVMRGSSFLVRLVFLLSLALGQQSLTIVLQTCSLIRPGTEG